MGPGKVKFGTMDVGIHHRMDRVDLESTDRMYEGRITAEWKSFTKPPSEKRRRNTFAE